MIALGSGISRLYNNTIGSKIAAASLDLMGSSDAFSKYIARRKDVDVNGYYDVIIHGNPENVFLLWNGKLIEASHRHLATILKHDQNYNNQPIRLLSCETGQKQDGLAQHLANKLGVSVKAPTELAWCLPNGMHGVAKRLSRNPNNPDWNRKGKYVTFYPGGKKK